MSYLKGHPHRHHKYDGPRWTPEEARDICHELMQWGWIYAKWETEVAEEFLTLIDDAALVLEKAYKLP